MRPKIIFYSFPLLAIFDHTRIIILTPSEIAMIGIIVISFFNFSADKRAGLVSIFMNNFLFILTLYFGWIFFNSSYHLFISKNISFFSLLKDTMKAVLGFLFVLSCGTFLKNSHDLHRILKYILIGQVLVITVALGCMVLFGSPTVLRSYQIFFIHSEFFQGTIFTNPNMYSRYIYLSFPILFAALPLCTKTRKKLIYFCFVVGSITILATVSRMAVLMLLTIFVLAGLLYGRRRIAIGAISLMIASLLIMGGVSEQLVQRFSKLENLEEQNRIIMLLVSLELIKEHPVAGTGAGSYNELMNKTGLFGDLKNGKAAHNNFVFMAVQFGIPGTLLFVSVFAIMLHSFWQRRKIPLSGAFSVAGFVTLLVFIGAGMSAVVLGLDLFWLLLGVLYVVQRRGAGLSFWKQPADGWVNQQYSCAFKLVPNLLKMDDVNNRI